MLARRSKMAVLADQLIGRAEELGSLERVASELDQGRAIAVELVGEAGIGKTRLLAELAARAEQCGHLLLSGSASELERNLPFSVFVDALDEYVESLEAGWLAVLDDDVQVELAHVFPSLSARAGGREPAPQHERYRSHRAVRALLDRLALPRATIYPGSPTAVIGGVRSTRRVGRVRASSASSVEMPRMAASCAGGTYGTSVPVSAWLSGSSAVAAIARPTPSPIATISAASQRAIARTWRFVAPVSWSSASSRPRLRAIITRVLTTAIDVKMNVIATNSGPSQRLVSRSRSSAVARDARSCTRSPGYRGASARRRADTAAGSRARTRIVPSSELVWWPTASSGASRASPNPSARL